MDIKDKRILEALQMQPLSEEEKASRHILGRLYGPIATCTESTRNGRLYNRPLWEKALVDEIFLEKVATKALFLELGHPADREETDMKQACACIPEVPKIVDNDLYAYVDILDTPNGRLLKTLVDYGFVPGISSRGSGDVLDNDQVDPETFFLETWDIVQLPAVRKARLNICESVDSKSYSLKRALAESYKAAKEEDKDTMKKALENLNIDIENELTDDTLSEAASKKALSVEDIPWDPELDTVLNEDAEEEAEEVTAESEETVEVEADSEEAAAETEEAEEADDADEDDSENETVEETEVVDLDTVADAIDLLQDYDSDTKIEFEPVIINGEDYPVEKLDSFVDEENDTLVIGVNCGESEETSEEESSEEVADEVDLESEEDSEADEIVFEDDEAADTEGSAEDNGDDEVIESLKETIRQKGLLEREVKDLRKAKAVGDAKVDELQESLKHYKNAFTRASAVASKVNAYKTQIKNLTEQLNKSENTINTLTEQVNSTQQLREDMDKKLTKEQQLTEQISSLTKQSEALEAKLQKQNTQYVKKLQERTELAKSYKARFIETLTRYVESKASMLGVQPSEITSRLNENYSLADVDAVCDQILDSTINYSRLPFSGRSKASARISESISTKKTKNGLEYGYEIDDSLLELAGLKK